MTTNPPPRACLGVLDLDALVYETPDGVTHWQPTTREAVPDALALFTVMERRGLTQLWVHPAYAAAKHLDQWPEDSYYRLAEMTGWQLTRAANGVWAMGFHTGVYGGRTLYFPDHEDRCDWRAARDANELLRALHAYRDALGGASYFRSPGATGTYLMRALHSGPRATELDTPAALPPPAEQAATEAPWQWIRPLTGDERARRYLHAYDRNGAYLAACAALPLGVGAAEHLREHDAAWPCLREGLPGYWRIVTPAESAPRLLPDLTAAHRAEKGKEKGKEKGGVWLTTPAARLLLETQGDAARIADAWVWRQHARYLEQWYKTLRDGRMRLMDQLSARPDDAAARIALDALKATYAHSIGWLAGAWEREKAQDGHAGVLYRPDWRHAIIATANANLYRAVVKAAQAQPDFVPFAINHDCIYVVSDNPDAATAYPNGIFKLGRGLGQWKIVLNGIPLSALAETFAGHEPPRLAALLAALREAAKETAHARV